MTNIQPPPPVPPPVNFGPLMKRLLRGVLILAAIVIGGYALLIGMWILLNPRW